MAVGQMWMNTIIYPDTGASPFPATIQVLSTAMPPPRPVGPGDSPNPPGGGTGIWGPTDPRPGPPIAGIPGLPGYEPPQLPTEPPEVVKPIPEGGGWGAAEVDGSLVWVYVPPAGAPSPKR